MYIILNKPFYLYVFLLFYKVTCEHQSIVKYASITLPIKDHEPLKTPLNAGLLLSVNIHWSALIFYASIFFLPLLPFIFLQIVAPYSGSVSVSKDGPNRIRLVPTDGGFINTVIFVDNIKPADNIPSDNFINVSVLKSILHKSIMSTCCSWIVNMVK